MFNQSLIENYIRSESELKGGMFTLYDPDREMPVALMLDGVRQVMDIRRGVHMACVGMTTPQGHKYDVDFIARGETRKTLDILDILIHNVDGQDRYEWYKERGAWRTRPAGASAP